MRTVIALILLVVSAAVAAQQPVPPQASAPRAAERQPTARHTLAADGEPVSPAKGWALSPAGMVDAEAPGVVTHGPGVRITVATDTTVFRPDWPLAGEFSVSALFQAQASSAAHGLTVGGERGMAFLVRVDGNFAVHQLQGGKRAAGRWSPRTLMDSTDAGPAANWLEIRVGLTEATFLINGIVVSVTPMAGGQLDGAPGVHVAAQGDVTVAGFTVHGAGALLKPVADR